MSSSEMCDARDGDLKSFTFKIFDSDLNFSCSYLVHGVVSIKSIKRLTCALECNRSCKGSDGTEIEIERYNIDIAHSALFIPTYRYLSVCIYTTYPGMDTESEIYQ